MGQSFTSTFDIRRWDRTSTNVDTTAIKHSAVLFFPSASVIC
jgi:hypothetical protein